MNSTTTPKLQCTARQRLGTGIKKTFFKRSMQFPNATTLLATWSKSARFNLNSLASGPGNFSCWKEKENLLDRKQVVMRNAVTTLGMTSVGVQWLIGVGVFVLCLAASVFFISALSTLSEVRLAARRVNIVMRLLELEMPETMAAMRLSSIEVSNCIEEFTELGTDLASGLRSSANAVVAAEKGLQEGSRMIQESILPAIQDRAPKAKKVLEELLQERAMLQHDQILNLNLTRQTTNRLRAIRQGIGALGFGFKAASFWNRSSAKTALKSYHQ